MKQITDEELLELPFEELFNRFKYFVESEANTYIRTYKYLNKDDLLSAGYEAIYQAKLRYDPTYGVKFRNYILDTVRFAIKTNWDRVYRKMKVEYEGEENVVQLCSYDYNDFETHGGHYEFTDKVINQIYLNNALDSLTERQRYITEASILEGLTQGEIAKVLGIKQASVSDALKKALVRLRVELTGETEEEIKEKTKGSYVGRFAKGITQKKNKRFQVLVYHNGASTYVGTYKTLREAKLNYNIKALEIIGKGAYQHII